MRITFSPALSWTHSVAIRFIVVFIVLVAGPRPEVVSAAVFAGQISPPETPTPEEQETIGNKRVQEAGGDQAIPSKKFPKTLFEAITRKKDNTGANELVESTEPERLDPDRPHLPEASTTAGRGTIILEGGYTFNERKLSSFSAHDTPEAVFRAGVLAEWFEVRIGQNFLKQERSISGVVSKSAGIQDLYLGAKVALNEQKRYLPAIALIPQMTVPTGNHDVTGGRVLPGLNVDGNWSVIKNRYSIEFVVANNRVADDVHHSHFELATGFTHAFQLSRKLEAFGEWDVFHGGIEPEATARHYAVGGLVFFATKEFAVDFRAGAGLNAQANRFLIGTGFAFRH
jgi:Putative MetA-pathway of phenol degradation